jgi:hypothetical protein
LPLPTQPPCRATPYRHAAPAIVSTPSPSGARPPPADGGPLLDAVQWFSVSAHWLRRSMHSLPGPVRSDRRARKPEASRAQSLSSVFARDRGTSAPFRASAQSLRGTDRRFCGTVEPESGSYERKSGPVGSARLRIAPQSRADARGRDRARAETASDARKSGMDVRKREGLLP